MSLELELIENRGFNLKLAHLRFTVQNALLASSVVGLLMGGAWVWAPFVITVVLVNIVDAVCGPDRVKDREPPLAMHRVMLLIGAFLLALNTVLFASYFTAGDPLGLVVALKSVGIDFDAARSSTSSLDLLAGVVALGFYYSVGMSSCHDLSHCVDSRFKVFVSRWISALILDPWFLIHHAAVHHRYLGLACDPATPRRGMSLYGFVARAAPSNTAFCSTFERDRLARQGRSYWTWKNRFLTGWGIVAAVVGGVFIIGGPKATAAFLASAAIGRLLLDSSAYIQHYGLLRVEGEPVDQRLSWNVYCVGTNALLNDIGRHADHHEHPSKPSVALSVNPGGPELHLGYLSLIGMTLIPPLFHWIMKPKLEEWDRKFATEAELAYMRANGIPCADR